MEHVLEKMEEDAPVLETTSSASTTNPEDRVKLFCLETALSPDSDLRTVKNRIWKGPGDLIITYSLIKPA